MNNQITEQQVFDWFESVRDQLGVTSIYLCASDHSLPRYDVHMELKCATGFRSIAEVEEWVGRYDAKATAERRMHDIKKEMAQLEKVLQQ